VSARPKRVSDVHRAPRLAGARAAVWKASRENIQRFLADAKVPTREELAAYWTGVADHGLSYIGRRPLTLVRRMGGKAYFPEGPLPSIPDTVHQLRIAKAEGGEGTRVWVDDPACLFGVVQRASYQRNLQTRPQPPPHASV
jgi:bifunctional non-homologous end joining protein LigD